MKELSHNIVYKLLKQAQEAGDIKEDINLELLVKIYFFRIDNLNRVSLFSNEKPKDKSGFDTIEKI